MTRRTRATHKTLALGAVTASLLALPLLSGPLHAAPNATAIMQKIAASNAKIRTYKATIQSTNSFNGRTTKMTNDIAAIPSSGKMRMTVTQTGAGGRAAKTIVVDDGKNIYNYSTASKSYMKQPHTMNMVKMQIDPLASFGANGATYKWLRSAKVGGRPAHVIRVTMKKMMPGMSPPSLLVYVDQATNRWRQIEMTSSFPGPNKTKNTMSMKIVVVKETINAAIPASTFKFTPPPGVKEMKTPSGFSSMRRPPAGRRTPR